MVELRAFKDKEVVLFVENTTLDGDRPGRIDVVARHHSHRYTRRLTPTNGSRYLQSKPSLSRSMHGATKVIQQKARADEVGIGKVGKSIGLTNRKQGETMGMRNEGNRGQGKMKHGKAREEKRRYWKRRQEKRMQKKRNPQKRRQEKRKQEKRRQEKRSQQKRSQQKRRQENIMQEKMM